jgi:hypothetical protein
MIIEPKKRSLSCIEGIPQINGILKTTSTYFFGWEFKVGNENIVLNKFKWYNADEFTKTRRIEIFNFPNMTLLAYGKVEALPNSWGIGDPNKEIILESGKTYRILIKVPKEQYYFYSKPDSIKFNEQDIKLLSFRYSTDMIELFETKILSEFVDFEYKKIK